MNCFTATNCKGVDKTWNPLLDPLLDPSIFSEKKKIIINLSFTLEGCHWLSPWRSSFTMESCNPLPSHFPAGSEPHRTALLSDRKGVPANMHLFSGVWPVVIWQVWHYSQRRSSISRHRNEEAIEQSPSPRAKDSNETAAMLIQPDLQERTDTSPGRHFLWQPFHSQYQQE